MQTCWIVIVNYNIIHQLYFNKNIIVMVLISFILLRMLSFPQSHIKNWNQPAYVVRYKLRAKTLKLIYIYIYIYKIYVCIFHTCSMQKFLGQGLNLCHSSDPQQWQCQSLTHSATKEPLYMLFIKVLFWLPMTHILAEHGSYLWHI